MALEQNSSVPLYKQLKDTLASDIRNAKYPRGSRMLSEQELEEKYNVSRITVRRAMSELCEEGLLIKKQGKGTFVTGNEISADMGKLLGFHDYMESHGKKVDSKVLEKSIIRIKPAIAREMMIEEDDDVFYMKRLMCTDGIPMMIDNCYIPLKRLPGFDEKFKDDDSIFRIMRSEYGIKFGKYYKVLKVKKANKDMAVLLDCPAGEPVFDLYKISYDNNGIPMHLSISYIKGENTSYKITGYDNDKVSHSGINWAF